MDVRRWVVALLVTGGLLLGALAPSWAPMPASAPCAAEGFEQVEPPMEPWRQ